MIAYRWLRATLLAICLGAAIDCQDSRPPLSSADSLAARRLSGEWDVHFQLVSSPMITLDTARAPHEIFGKLSLLVNTSINRSFSLMGVPTNYGSYDLDLTPFGFDPRVSGATPTVIAGRLSDDSVEIILSPDNEAEEVVLVGRLVNGTITGTWRVSLPSAGGQGTFRLTRPPGWSST